MPKSSFWNKSYIPVFIVSISSLFYLYDFTLRVLPSVMAENLMAQFKVTAEGYGFLSSFFFIGYIIMQVPCGLLYDRFGPRRLLTINCLIAATAALFFIATDSFVIASIARFFMGIGAAFAYVGTLVLAMRWLDSKYYAMTAGIVQLMGSLGAIMGQAPFAYWMTVSTPIHIMVYVALFGYALALLFWLLIRDHPPAMHDTIIKHSKTDTVARLSHVLINPQNWVIACYGFAIWAPISIFAALWDVQFLATVDHISSTSAATLASGIWVGVAVGGPILGWVSATIKSRKIPLVFGAATGLIASSLILYDAHINSLIQEILLILFGFAASAQAVTFGAIEDINSPRVAGTAAGFNNMAIVLGGAFLQPLVGILLRSHVPMNQYSIPPHYMASDYRYALMVLPICFALALVIAVFQIKETKCQHQY